MELAKSDHTTACAALVRRRRGKGGKHVRHTHLRVTIEERSIEMKLTANEPNEVTVEEVTFVLSNNLIYELSESALIRAEPIFDLVVFLAFQRLLPFEPLHGLLEHRLGKARALLAVRKDGEDATIRARRHEIPRDGFLGLDAAFQRDHAKRGCVLRELVAR